MPVNITGTVRERLQLTTDAANPQWQRGSGSLFYDIPGATGATFTPSFEEVGVALRVRDTGTAEVSAATAVVAEGPIVYDTFTEGGGGTVTLAGHQADVGGSWIQHPSGVAGVVIDRSADVAQGNVTSGNNFFINQQQIPVERIRINGRIYRNGANLNSVLLAFSNSGSFDGYRIYFDTNIIFTRYASSSTASNVQAGTTYARTNALEQDFRLTAQGYADRTRFHWKAPNSSVVNQVDDTHANRESPLNRYVGIGPRTSNYWDNFTVLEIDNSPIVTMDGMWTWYTDPRGIHHDGVDYISYIDSVGTNKLTKRDAAGTETTVTVGIANNPADDHNNPALVVLPGGKMAAFYSDHTDAVGTRYKVTTNALPDISAFSTERVIAPAAGENYVSYSNPFILSDGVLRVIRRSFTTRYEIASAPAANVEAGTETWTLTTLMNIHQAYAKFAASPDNHRLYMLFGNDHPRDANVSLYAAYLDVQDGTLSAHRLDGTEIALPITTANATLVRATAGGDTNWAYDMAVGPDGRPRFLACRYPGGPGVTTGLTNIEYWHYRWDGTGIVATQFASNQKSLYNAESYYAGGMCFDGNNPTIVFASVMDADGFYQVEELRVDEATNTFTKVRNVSSRTLLNNCRPFSPKGHDGDVAVYWWRGTYNSYTSYLTELHRASGAALIVAGGAEGPVGLATETSVGFALGAVQLRAVGLTTETDTALARAAPIALPVGLATESSSALARTSVQIRPAEFSTTSETAIGLSSVSQRAVGLSTTTDAAISKAAVQIRTTGLAAEATAAFARSALSLRPTGLATESDLASARGSARPAGLSSETQTAFGRTATQIRSVGLATSSDLALSLSAGSALGVGVAVETATAIARTGLYIRLVGLATETEQALPRGSGRPAGLVSELAQAFSLVGGSSSSAGLAVETSSALARTGRQVRPVGLASETGQALRLGIGAPVGRSVEADLARASSSGRPAGVANENSAAFALLAGSSSAVGLAFETDLAFALSAPGKLGLASETDEALALAPVSRRAAGLSTSAELAQALPVVIRVQVGLATETNEARPLSFAIAVGLAEELNIAFSLTAFLPHDTPPDRTTTSGSWNRNASSSSFDRTSQAEQFDRTTYAPSRAA